MGGQRSISETFRTQLDELELYLEAEPDEELARHVLPLATVWVLEDVGLDLPRLRMDAYRFVIQSPDEDRVVAGFGDHAADYVGRRMLLDERERERPEAAEALLGRARAEIADRAGLLEREGFPRTAQAFRRLLDETAGGRPPADLVWNALALRIVEPWLDDPITPGPPPSAPPAPAPE